MEKETLKSIYEVECLRCNNTKFFKTEEELIE